MQFHRLIKVKEASNALWVHVKLMIFIMLSFTDFDYKAFQYSYCSLYSGSNTLKH